MLTPDSTRDAVAPPGLYGGFALSLAVHAVALALLASHASIDLVAVRADATAQLQARLVAAEPLPVPSAPAADAVDAVDAAPAAATAEQSSPPRLLDYPGELAPLPVRVDAAGSLQARISVSGDGRALAVVVEQSSLPDAVVKAVVGDLYRARYQPARVGDKAQASDMRIVVELDAD